MKLNKIVTGMAFVAALSAGQTFAATNGALASSSSGTTDVSLEIANRVQLSSVENLPLGAWGGSGNLTGGTDFCVYRSGGDNYKLTLTADTGAFQVTSSTTSDNIPFSAFVDDDSDATDGEELTYNTASAVPLVGSNAYDCSGTDNAELFVSFAEDDLRTASTANNYKATVTILVEPI